MQFRRVCGQIFDNSPFTDPLRHLMHKRFRPVHRGIVKQDITALVKLRTQLINTLDNHRRVDAAFDHIRMQVVGPFQKTEDMQAPTMAAGRHLDGGAFWLPRVRPIWLEAEASAITGGVSELLIPC